MEASIEFQQDEATNPDHRRIDEPAHYESIEVDADDYEGDDALDAHEAAETVYQRTGAEVIHFVEKAGGKIKWIMKRQGEEFVRSEPQ